MKKIKQVIYAFAFLLLTMGCDKDFVEINTDPFALNDVDPQLLFAGTQRTSLGDGWESENTVVQHTVNPYNLGATTAFNFNADIDLFQAASWGQYTGPVKTLTHILYLLESQPERVNLKSITRIWKAQVFMNIVDHYGDVPYFDAGYAYIKGEEYFYPKYDDDARIYDDLYKELKEAIAALDPTKDFVSADLFYGSKAFYSKTSNAAQVAQWKKAGNSLLLRLGMRYSKLDPAKAAGIVAEAFSGGVMTANTDNTFVVYDGTVFTNVANGNLINNNPRYYYVSEPFVNQLKSTNDPRGKYIVSSYANPNGPLNDKNPNTDILQQFGVPVGIIDSQLPRGSKGSGKNYSQLNVRVAASTLAPTFWITYAQTSLLLAEAAHRGWIPGGEVAARQYYEAGIKADMENYSIILTRTKKSDFDQLPEVTQAEKDAYIAHPSVAYNSNDALKLINTQYWIVNICNGQEAWANFRRSGYPALSRNAYNENLMANGGDGFVHRFSYPDEEKTRNKANYEAAVAAIGGTDDLVSRVFWDKK